MFPVTFDLISFDITAKELAGILKAVQIVKTHHFYATKCLKETIKRFENGTLEYGMGQWNGDRSLEDLRRSGKWNTDERR